MGPETSDLTCNMFYSLLGFTHLLLQLTVTFRKGEMNIRGIKIEFSPGVDTTCSVHSLSFSF